MVSVRYHRGKKFYTTRASSLLAESAAGTAEEVPLDSEVVL
jgi:hypothetical protein